MASPTEQTCVWVNSGSWWWTGRPGVLQSRESQRVRHKWETELNWTDTFLQWRFKHSHWCIVTCRLYHYTWEISIDQLSQGRKNFQTFACIDLGYTTCSRVLHCCKICFLPLFSNFRGYFNKNYIAQAF